MPISVAAFVAVVAGIVLWTNTPPGDEATAGILTTINSYETAIMPDVPDDAETGRPLTASQIATLEGEITERLRQLLTADLYEDSVTFGRLPLLVAMEVSDAVASGSEWPHSKPDDDVKALRFVRRTIDGKVIVQLINWRRTAWNHEAGPFVVHQFVLERSDETWKISGEKYLGITRDGQVTPAVGS